MTSVGNGQLKKELNLPLSSSTYIFCLVWIFDIMVLEIVCGSLVCWMMTLVSYVYPQRCNSPADITKLRPSLPTPIVLEGLTVLEAQIINSLWIIDKWLCIMDEFRIKQIASSVKCPSRVVVTMANYVTLHCCPLTAY